MKTFVAIVLGLFSGVLVWVEVGMLMMRPPKPEVSPTTAGVVTLVVWIGTAILIRRNAVSVAKVFSRGFLVGAAEWLLMVPVGLIYTARVAEYASTRAASDAGKAGALVGSGIVGMITGGVAVAMALFCLICYAVTYFLTREMKREAAPAVTQ